jgi:hypothetical protein
VLEIKPDRMVSLGYGKYWRSDAIVGLMPIDEDRGPGRRTQVYTSTLPEPIVASRSEDAILEDMAVPSVDVIRSGEVREAMADLMAAFDHFPDVIDRMLATEAHFDVAGWIRRLRTLLQTEPVRPLAHQNELFAGDSGPGDAGRTEVT